MVKKNKNNKKIKKYKKSNIYKSGCTTFEMFSVVREFLLSKAPHTLDAQGLYLLQTFYKHCLLIAVIFI
jgi:hypothetical protein